MHIYIKIKNITDSLTPLLSWLIGCDNTFLVIFSGGGQDRSSSASCHLPPGPPISEIIATVTLTSTNRNTDQYPELMPRSRTSHTGSRKGLFNAGWSPRWSLEMAPDILTAPAISRRLRLGDCDIVTTGRGSSSKLSVRVKWSENNQRWKE